MNTNFFYTPTNTTKWTSLFCVKRTSRKKAYGKSLAILALTTATAISMHGVSASVSYLDDVNEMSPKIVDTEMKEFNHPFPKVMLSELITMSGDLEKYSKYDIIQTFAFQLKKVAILQQKYPNLKYIRQFNLEHLGYYSNVRCDQGHGLPFEQTAASTANCAVYAGHWLYEPGKKLSAYLGAGSTSVKVSNTANLKAGYYAVIYDTTAGSFKNAEHVKITSVNHNTNTITLSRGYKSSAKAHPGGSIIAQHVIGQAGGDTRNWMYNLSSVCPLDGNGNRYIDYVPEWLVDNQNRDQYGVKQATKISGIAFDIDFRYSFPSKNADTNNDLSADFGLLPAQGNVWSDGIDRLYEIMTRKFPDYYIGGGLYDSPGHGTNHGIQLEGWPTAKDFHGVVPDYSRIDGLLADYMLRHREHIEPQLIHAVGKTPTRLYPNGTGASSNKPFRFALGTTLLGDGYYGQQNKIAHPDPWYDEYAVDIVPGSNTYGHAIVSTPADESRIHAHKGWLGQPLGERRRIYNDIDYQETKDLLADKGTFDFSINNWTGQNVSVSQDYDTSMDGPAALRASTHHSFDEMIYSTKIKGPNISLIKDQWYTLVFSMKADQVREIKANVGWRGQPFMVNNEWRRYVMAFKAPQTGLNSIQFYVGKDNTPVWLDSVHVFKGNPNIFRRDFENGIVVVNATDQTKVVDLGGTFMRIKGKQDPINDGSKLNSVTIKPYDIALLVRLDGQSLVRPVSPDTETPVSSEEPDIEVPINTEDQDKSSTSLLNGSECGTPNYDANTDQGTFLWKDCGTTNAWHLEVAGGGSAAVVAYLGNITSPEPISLSSFNIEKSDVINTSNKRNISYNLYVIKNGKDRLNFNISESGGCFNTNKQLFLGTSRIPVDPPLDLGTLNKCDVEGMTTTMDSGTQNDSVAVVSKVSFPLEDRIWIRATSDHLPLGSATLTAVATINGVNTTLGTIPWRDGVKFYQTNYYGLTTEPDCVTVISNFGGQDQTLVSASGSCNSLVL